MGMSYSNIPPLMGLCQFAVEDTEDTGENRKKETNDLYSCDKHDTLETVLLRV